MTQDVAAIMASTTYRDAVAVLDRDHDRIVDEPERKSTSCVRSLPENDRLQRRRENDAKVNRHLAAPGLRGSYAPNRDQTGDLPIRRKGPTATFCTARKKRAFSFVG